jgi:hypothetical protein
LAPREGGDIARPNSVGLWSNPSSASGGQIAISARGGEVISANSSGSPLVREQGYKSIPGYQGWAFPSNVVAGGSGSPLATPPLPRHASARPAHRPTPAPTSAASRHGAAGGAGNRWLSSALADCLVLLAMFATMFAVRGSLRARNRYSRHRHDAEARVAAANGHNPVLPQPAGSVPEPRRYEPPMPELPPSPEAAAADGGGAGRQG